MTGNVQRLDPALSMRNAIWLMVAVCSILSISLAISQSKWIYLGIALLPGTIYISLS